MSKYVSGSIPVSVTARLASPRMARTDPVMVGETAVTSGMASIWPRIFGHWSIEITRWLGRCTAASSISPAALRKGRAT
ncbi:hypothetical protein AB7M42_004872 [Bradyrhizobium diazoefficiens]|nr:hypothetical protein F07S3_51730 [Bradyrhizobium diazoefficiens]BCA13024.1 hypothetical protein BDHF08_48710 [Bradyrhizobium diazoefficiens]BCA21803.1 hypothetical protein BDHH15_50180 [Bradyrhizobium diazoefficiens]BCE39968.1 hypothetical protein XF3B_49990 [Bradyrhizobium diazoefficiens]BCE57430.1 hypothetical protein XF5B_49420 [Bradyrhizobium diazoefficiens]